MEASEEVMDMMEECMTTAEAGFHGIAAITSKDYYTYTHSVNVGLYCMTFGVKSKMSKNDTGQIFLGGMLHDVGKSKIDWRRIRVNEIYALAGGEILTGMKCYTT